MVLVSLISRTRGESFPMQPIYREPAGTKKQPTSSGCTGAPQDRKLQGICSCCLNHTLQTAVGEKRRKPSPKRDRDSWGWYIAQLPSLARTTPPISLFYLTKADFLHWTVKDWFLNYRRYEGIFMEFQDQNIKAITPCFGWNDIFSQIPLKTKTKCTVAGMIKILQHL